LWCTARSLRTYTENNLGIEEGDKEEDVKGGDIVAELRLVDKEEKGHSSVDFEAWVPSRGKQKGMVTMGLIFNDGLTTKQFENISQLTVIILSCGSSKILCGRLVS
jgi:hypothetical protein